MIAPLVVKNLSKKYKNEIIFSEVNLTFDPGIHILIGLNGSGKSTFLASIVGIIKLDNGEIIFNDLKLELGDIHQYKKIGYISDLIPLIDEFTGIEYLKFLCEVYQINELTFNERMLHFKSELGIEDSLFNNRISNLSTGNKKIISFISSMLHSPELLILDEPFSGIDYSMKAKMIEILNTYKNDSRVIIISMHEIEDVDKLYDRILLLTHKCVIQINNLKKGIKLTQEIIQDNIDNYENRNV